MVNIIESIYMIIQKRMTIFTLIFIKKLYELQPMEHYNKMTMNSF